MSVNLRSISSVSDRRKTISEFLGVSLSHIGTYPYDVDVASSRHCENMVGFVAIPVGIAGPLLFTDTPHSKKSESYIPLATTEGALIASVNRGCKAISASGGVTTHVERLGQTRGPVFSVSGITEGYKLKEFILEKFILLKKTAAQTSGHVALIGVSVKPVGQYVFVRFSFDSGDAMGMNMATIATEAICSVIEKQTKARVVSVAGNFDVDKKPSWLNVLSGRGTSVWAEAVITKKVLSDVLKTDADKLFDTWLAKCMLGSVMSGTMGNNAHIANCIAALFIATGQDPAHVVEASASITTIKAYKNGDLYASVFLPALQLGTVGGGTGLKTQEECLKILGVLGNDKKNDFACIAAGACLAGEISLLASLAQGSLGNAHARLGRGGK